MVHKLFELIDDVKHKLTDEEYLAIANACKELFQTTSDSTTNTLTSTLSVALTVMRMRNVGIPKVELHGVSEAASQKYDHHHTLVTNALNNLHECVSVFVDTLTEFVECQMFGVYERE
jgi:hypothetical protein